MTMYRDFYRKTTTDGNNEKITEVLFGSINNSDIQTVEVSKDGNRFTLTGRYYFKVGDYRIVRGLNNRGKVIDRQGG
ncbi:hypothetical protein [Ammoniphilus sp. 3BR4]|uniref:hypothetical protein n=1 Tax=Ammoniphilus sp. 3BR4 TaxID=3158265 RepID=UPI00346536BE